jgi:hypothetical protein
MLSLVSDTSYYEHLHKNKIHNPDKIYLCVCYSSKQDKFKTHLQNKTIAITIPVTACHKSILPNAILTAGISHDATVQLICEYGSSNSLPTQT